MSFSIVFITNLFDQGNIAVVVVGNGYYLMNISHKFFLSLSFIALYSIKIYNIHLLLDILGLSIYIMSLVVCTGCIALTEKCLSD